MADDGSTPIIPGSSGLVDNPTPNPSAPGSDPFANPNWLAQDPGVPAPSAPESQTPDVPATEAQPTSNEGSVTPDNPFLQEENEQPAAASASLAGPIAGNQAEAAADKLNLSGQEVAQLPPNIDVSALAKFMPKQESEKPKSKLLSMPIFALLAKVNLIIAFVILLVIAVATSAGIYAMTKGPIAVTVHVPETTSSSSSASASTTSSASSTSLESTSSTSSISSTPTAANIYVFMVALGSEANNGVIDPSTLPAGSTKVDNDYFVKLQLTNADQTKPALNAALDGLLGIKDSTYGQPTYHNFLAATDLKAVTSNSTTDTGTTVVVDLVGVFQLQSNAEYVYAKEQLERTIQTYTLNYQITYNGDATAYRCLGNTDGQCS